MKLSGVFFAEDDLNRIALVAPDVKVNISVIMKSLKKDLWKFPKKWKA